MLRNSRLPAGTAHPLASPQIPVVVKPRWPPLARASAAAVSTSKTLSGLTTAPTGGGQAGTTEGPVEALTYGESPAALLVVADDRGISTSTDLGTIWTTGVTRG